MSLFCPIFEILHASEYVRIVFIAATFDDIIVCAIVLKVFSDGKEPGSRCFAAPASEKKATKSY